MQEAHGDKPVVGQENSRINFADRKNHQDPSFKQNQSATSGGRQELKNQQAKGTSWEES